ncbi:hypothetical protein BUALT_Bualt10G0138900 [Buddleja alternifolia]|uniref:Exostosin GT47 domain-containing protein n=1 Tax=Buddleja alternifolia TaxID=168488 RepID=A0AAV6WZR5_9LAMI|nr:hypothetical protein BUALT_Bualt10G0138900 [Buddleja alternifolia]
MERLEEGLARARAAIREAAGRRGRRSYTSSNYNNNQTTTFIPRGSIYRNPYAFHQSYIEMEKRFKIWAYKQGEPPLFHRGPMRDIYSIEGHVMDELESVGNPFAARDPKEAHAFFLPVGIAKIVRYLYSPRLDYDRRRLQNVVADYIGVLANKYPYWNRSAGADHFFVACHDWGPDVSAGNPELFKNLIRVLCNANTSEGFQPTRDVSLPEIKVPGGLGLGPPDLNQSPDNRSALAFFAGDYSNIGKTKTRISNGYEVASPRLIESMLVGCVPVIISDGYVLPFSDVLDWSRLSVHIPVARIPDIKIILEGIPRDEYLEKQKQVMKVKRHFVVHRPAQPFDLIHMVLHSVWLRRLNVRLQ